MKLSLNKKIMLIGIIPLIALCFFIYTIVIGKISVKANVNNIDRLCQYIINASALVHELQKERGASAAYIGSGGNKMRDVLEDNKQNTNKALTSFQQYMTSYDGGCYSASFNEKVRSPLNQLRDLSSKRTAVIGLSITKDEIVGYYTTIIANIIKSFESVILEANHPQISGHIYTCVNFISAKELSGIERAVLSSIVATNKTVDTRSLNNWFSAWNGQERLMMSFENLASQEVLSLYKSNHTGQVVEKVLNIRNVVVEKAGEGNFGITADEVYEALTQRINVLKDIEDYQLHNIRNISSEISLKARNEVIVYSSIGVGVFAVVLALTLILTTRIVNFFKYLLGELTSGSSELLTASEQISDSSQSLSEGASEQAASIQETSATMEEITSMTKQNADNALEASKLATACNHSVEHGNTTVVEMNNAMKNIHESSGKIADIIKIIEGIAFQTNLLALNAAVEAARAGEHGRGFAVVAEEVRNLAQRSSTASKDITTLISDSVHKATTGMELVKRTEDVFAGVVAQVKKVTDLVNEISSASDEQNNGIQQINKAIQQMDQVVQQNAASAEETASSSEELTAQAQALNDLVNKVGAEVGMETKASGGAVRSTVSKTRKKLPINIDAATSTEFEGNKTKLVTADYV